MLLLRTELRALHTGADTYVWIRDLYDAEVVYEVESPSTSEMLRRSYVIAPDNAVTFGEPERVIGQTVYSQVSEATKTEDGKAFQSKDYAYVPDPDSPSTWKLRLTDTPGGAPSPRIVGAAIAALGPGGFRGQKVQIPSSEMAAVKRKVRAAWKKLNPDADPEDVPAAIREVALESGPEVELTGDLIPLIERAVGEDSTTLLKIIQPGWGSSGYYSPDLLRRDGPSVFTEGLQMFWDHPTPGEEAERPERSLRDLAGKLLTPATWMEQGPAGPGLYAKAQVFAPFAESVEELAPHIGVSIRAMGRGKEGEIDGRSGPIIEQLTSASSVDYVTRPGAGGAVLQLLESARDRSAPQDERGDPMTLEALKEAQGEITTLREQLQALRASQIREVATNQVTRELATTTLPVEARTRIQTTLTQGTLPLTEGGELDTATLTTQVSDAVKAELAYLQAVAPSGWIRDLGSAESSAPTEEERTARLVANFKRMGLSEAGAQAAAQGRR